MTPARGRGPSQRSPHVLVSIHFPPCLPPLTPAQSIPKTYTNHAHHHPGDRLPRPTNHSTPSSPLPRNPFHHSRQCPPIHLRRPLHAAAPSTPRRRPGAAALPSRFRRGRLNRCWRSGLLHRRKQCGQHSSVHEATCSAAATAPTYNKSQ